MQIAVISDSHRDMNSMKESLSKMKNAEILFHLGDNIEDIQFYKDNFHGRIINIKGNCDFNCKEQSEKVVDINNIRFFITHGHNYNVKENIFRLNYKAYEVQAKVVLYGHTHIPNIEYENGIWFINPGSISLPRVKNKTLSIIDVSEDRITPSIVDMDKHI